MSVIDVRSGSKVLEAVRMIAPEISARSAAMEQARALTPDVIDLMVHTGVFRMFVPKEFGGEELGFPEVYQVIRELARADASVGWVSMIAFAGATIPLMFPEARAREMYANGPDLKVRGVFAPTGAATPVEGGYRVSGRWSFASGTPDTQYIALGTLVMDNGVPRMSPEGIPEMRFIAFPVDEVTFLDNWHVAGLKATSSQDVVINDVFVPEERALNLFGPLSPLARPNFRLPFWLMVTPGHAGVATGVARGALDDLAAIAATKHSALNPTMRLSEDPVFQHTLGVAATRLESVEAFAEREIARMWDAAVSGAELTPYEILRGKSMAPFVTTECMTVVETAFRLAGSASLYESAALQRRLRDLEVASQHIAVSGRDYRTLGAQMCGEPLGPMALA